MNRFSAFLLAACVPLITSCSKEPASAPRAVGSAAFPPKLAAGTPGSGWKSDVSTNKLDVGVSTKDEDIRQRLLSYTPKGSDATIVLRFVVDDLRPAEGAISYFTYVDALESGRTNRLNVVREDERPSAVMPMPADWTPRYIYLVIGTYPDSQFIWKITAKWTFDNNDKLVNVAIGRDNSP